MTQVSHPTPAQVRAWMNSPDRKEGPPPTPEDIRTQLGWRMLHDERVPGGRAS